MHQCCDLLANGFFANGAQLLDNYIYGFFHAFSGRKVVLSSFYLLLNESKYAKFKFRPYQFDFNEKGLTKR